MRQHDVRNPRAAAEPLGRFRILIGRAHDPRDLLPLELIQKLGEMCRARRKPRLRLEVADLDETGPVLEIRPALVMRDDLLALERRDGRGPALDPGLPA